MKSIPLSFKTFALTSGALLIGSALFGKDSISGAVPEQELLMLLITTMIIVALVCLMLTVSILALIRSSLKEAAQADESKQVALAQTNRWSWSRIQEKLTDAVPVEKEASIDLGHDYDGIRELDNALPPWWKYGFYVSIVFSVAYLWVFHVNSDWSSGGEYETEMAIAAAEKEAFLAKAADLVDESNVVALTDAASISHGQSIYQTSCAACHGMAGEGGVGPNLTDAYWLHGGDVKGIFTTIKYGVPAKGMIAWQAQLKPKDMQDVSSYILSIGGSDPPNAKEPQGELYQTVESVEADTTDAVAAVIQ
ncbi:MAG: cbb3-type cytochrome c oxidase N-terminal domain-containing protein [Bacteroidota bacterium]